MANPTEKSSGGLSKVEQDWQKLKGQFTEYEELQKEYQDSLTKAHKLEAKCLAANKSNSKQMMQLKEKLKTLESSLSETDQLQMHDILNEVSECKGKLHEMFDQLPKEHNGIYLDVILGRINISLLNKADRFRYKDEYEKFKLTVTVLSIVIGILAYLFQKRFLDAVFCFLLVWYYCTLTIRESILRVNGSRIKGWWVAHHYISAVLCGVVVTWPKGVCYGEFRRQFLLFSIYIGLVQVMQFFYQRGSLYRLRALGMSHSMDITVEGFQSWMFRGLSFLLPFLFVGYFFQVYNSFVLIQLWRKRNCQEWQVPGLAALFAVLAIGNIVTTLGVVVNKFSGKHKMRRRKRLETKYSTEEKTE